MAKYYIFSISANVTPAPTTTKEIWLAELVMRTGTGEQEEVENKHVGAAGTLEEAMAIAESECDILNEATQHFARAMLAKFPNV